MVSLCACTRGLRSPLSWYQNFPSALELRLIVTGLFPCLLEFIVDLLGVRAMLVNQHDVSGRSLGRKVLFVARNARARNFF